VQPELALQPVGEAGEAPEVLVERRRLAPLFAQRELDVDELERFLAVGLQGRVQVQLGLGGHPLPPAPALDRVGAQHLHQP
jgi:hypothetical protein